MAARNLDRATIVEAALKILRDEGLHAVSLRNVASAVGARAPSLYWHVPNKSVLFGYMSEHIFRACLDQVPPSTDWREWLRNLAIVVWRSQRQTRDLHQLMLQSVMEPEVLRSFTAHIVDQIIALGIDSSIAFDAQKSVLSLTTGWTMMPHDPAFQEIAPEPAFLRCLDSVIRGWDNL